MNRLLAMGLVAALLTACAPPPSTERPDPEQFRKVVLAGPFNEPVDLDVLSDGSVFVVERNGKIFHWREGQEAREVLAFDDLFALEQANEFGLLAIAADPGFRRNGWVYIMYDTKPADQVVQRVSRMRFDGERIDRATEAVLLEIPYDPNCCHTGGAIRFGPDDLLYIATGDNTNPWVDDGYGPMDARPDRVGFDALRSAGNTMDLRGKILRIRPTREGGYEIPEGNLFTDAAQGRPEIYVMGARNPYTLAFDSESNVIYYGDVGPDADEDGPRGSRGYDEINRITRPSNMGWPLFIGENHPYHAYDYVTEEIGAAFDPANPVNNSPRNTGARTLPPAQPAFIAYPYEPSETFGEGGRNALVAGLYHRPRRASERAFPAFFEDKLFIADFMRRWMKVVTLDENGGVASIEPFAEHIELAAPLDFEFGPDGALYVIEYGSEWFQANPDSALSRIEFTPRAP